MKEMKYIYGPVPSRRLGISLGISPIPKKTCNYSCIYCQLGRTNYLTNTYYNVDSNSDGKADGVAQSGTSTISGTPIYNSIITDSSLDATDIINVSGAGYQQVQYTGVARWFSL